MEMRQLRYFLAVTERLHFTKAAEFLHVSQPALSQQIRMLEEEIGVKLLERAKRRVQLTPAGVAFRAHAESALQEASEAVSDARMIEGGEGGSIRIGFVTTTAIAILPALLDRFCSRFPQATVELRELDPGTQLESLEHRRIDVGFSSVPSALPSLECKVLGREEWIVALPDRHPAAQHRTVDLKQLSEERFLLPPRGLLSGIHEGIIDACHRSGFVPKSIQPLRLAETAVCLVAGNFGVALIPQSFRRLKVSGVVYKRLKHEIPPIKMYAIKRKSTESPLVDNFWTFVEAIAGTKAKGERDSVPKSNNIPVRYKTANRRSTAQRSDSPQNEETPKQD